MRVVANLDCELAWAGGPALPAHVRAKIAVLGTLVRAIVPDGETCELVLPAPIDRARIPDVAASPPWSIADSTDGPALYWGTPVPVPVPVPGSSPLSLSSPWRDQLPRLAPPSLDVIRRVADRRFALALAHQLGVALPGAHIITSIDELDPADDHAWIAKAPITAAGRDRVRRRGPLDDATCTRVARLLARAGALIVEPWLERIVDVGQPGIILDADRFTLLPAHALHVDPTGGFAGITIPAREAALGLTTDEHAQLRATATAVATHLARAGYRGPFTIDAFAYRDATGARRFHPLCEINPRLTFGLVARAWAERLGRAPVTLRVDATPAPAHAITLIAPTADDPTTAWLAPAPAPAPAAPSTG